MHACIFGLTTHTPTLGLGYQPKFRELFDELDLSEWVQPVDSWQPDWAFQKISEIIEGKTRFEQEIQDKIKAIEIKIERTLKRALEENFK